MYTKFQDDLMYRSIYWESFILNVIEVIIDNASLDLNEHNEKVLKVNDVLTIIAHKAYS